MLPHFYEYEKVIKTLAQKCKLSKAFFFCIFDSEFQTQSLYVTWIFNSETIKGEVINE